ncbi:DUF58 domain-containing protein [Arthrobacter oryzae]|uniref:DUF58 domain-containing protein n=1 Tax=Arthrobacter oryzae TaxID=409290 RepID=UPI002786E79D|nr:DUF58 domain-containing protein [Arthrobacter oryzae]MDQ0076528.1 uncharacterized protein (DUF58 family) [Arthrobacter oryzae]
MPRTSPAVAGLGRTLLAARPAALELVTVLGWQVLAAGLGFGIIGALLGWEETITAAAAALALILVAAVFVVGRTSYGVAMDLAKTRVEVGEMAVGSITVSNISARPLLPAAIELPVGSGTASFAVPRLRPEDIHEDLFTIPTAVRSVIKVGPVRSVRADPLRLLSRQVTLTDAVDLFVHPRTVSLAGSAEGLIRDLEGMPTTNLTNADVSFHALRDYVPGDDRRHIHWKTTARTGKLMVRQFEETRRSHLAMALSTNLDEYAAGEDLELAISAAASIGKQAIREQREISVMTQDGRLRTDTARVLLDGMTRLVGAESRTTATDVARLTGDAVPNASVMFLVLGTSVTPGQLRTAAASAPPGVRCFAIRCQAGAALDRRAIGDLTVLTLGELTELPRLLVKAVA